MAAATGSELVTPQDEPPYGTCRPAIEGGIWWWVRGNSGWHLVNADTGECHCKHWQFRCAFTRNLCSHGEALAEHIERLTSCPICHGRAWLIPSGLIVYVRSDGTRDTDALPCIHCEGSGLMSDEELREAFK